MKTTTISPLRIEYSTVDDLQPAAQNPKGHNQPAIRESIVRFGYADPVVVDERTGRLVSGHGRREELMAMRAAGLSAPAGIEVGADGKWRVPVVRGWASKNDDDAQAFLLAANKITEAGGWVRDQYAEIVDALERRGAGLEKLGWSARELADLANEVASRRGGGGGEDPGETPPPEVAVSQRGIVYVLGPHRIMCGDSTSVEDVKTLMDGKRAVLMSTDPPYLVDYDDGGGHPQHFDAPKKKREAGDKDWDAFKDTESAVAFFVSFIRAALDHALDDSPALYHWHAFKRQSIVETAWMKCGLLLHQQIIWAKSSAVLTRSHFMWQHEPAYYGWKTGNVPPLRPKVGGEASTVWPIANIKAEEGKGLHPTAKPLEIFARPIQYHTRRGDIVYEPFSGSGSQLIAAAQAERRCFAMELDPRYVDVARIRWTAWARGAGIDPGSDALDVAAPPSPSTKKGKKKALKS